MPAVPFSPCGASVVSGSPCPDQSVQMLEHIFGPIITSLSQGGDPNSTQMASNIIATMFYAFNTGLLAVAGIIVGYVALMGVANTANDGEAFGKDWSTWWTPARILYGGGMLLPTPSGYNFAQIVVFTMALWGVGFANTIYNAAFTMSVITPNGLVSGVNAPGAFFGMRDFAKHYLEASYCARAANAIYNPSGGGSTSSAINFENYSTFGAADYTTTSGGYSNAVTKITDRGPGFTDAGHGACGIVTLSTYNAQSQNAQSTTTINGTTTTTTDAMGQALESLHQTVQGYKVQAAKDLMRNLDSWVATWPSTANDTGWSNVDSSQFNTYVTEAENQVVTQMAQAAQSTAGTTNNQLQDYAKAMTAGGWATAGGWFQRVGMLRGQMSGVMADPVGTVTPPALNDFPTGNAGTAELINSVAAVTAAIDSKAEIHATADGTTTSWGLDLSSVFPKSIKDANVASIQTTFNNKMGGWVNDLMANMVGMVTGANTNGIGNGKTTPYCGTAGQLGGSLNRMKCVGDYLTTTTIVLRGAATTVQMSAAAMETVASLASTKVLGTGLDLNGAITALNSLVTNWAVPMIAGLYNKTGDMAFLFGVFLPSLPYILFMMVVVGWVLSVLMTSLAVPLWMCLHMTPDRTFIGSQRQGYLLLLSLFTRPALAVIGLIAAFLVSDPIIDFISTSFFSMRAAIVSSTGTVGWIAQFDTFVWWFELYGAILIPVLYMIFGLPQALPGHVLKYIGGGVDDLGETHAQGQIAGAQSRMLGQHAAMGGSGGFRGLREMGGGGGGGGQSPPETPRLGGGSQGPGGGIAGGPGGGGRRQASAINVGPQGVTSSVNAGPDGYNPPPRQTGNSGKGSLSQGLGVTVGSMFSGRGFKQAVKDGALAASMGKEVAFEAMRPSSPAATSAQANAPAEGSVRPAPPPAAPGGSPPLGTPPGAPA